jgi:hypothetical protein
VASVAFYANGTLIGTALNAPYQVLWTPASVGTYSLTAVATDNEGATTTSSALSGTVLAVADSQAPPPPPPPPASVTFTASPDHDTNVFYYTVRIFTVGASVGVDAPVSTFDIGKPASIDGECTADITSFLGAVPSGSFFAVVSAVGLGGESLSPPSASFTN